MQHLIAVCGFHGYLPTPDTQEFWIPFQILQALQVLFHLPLPMKIIIPK